MRLIGTTALFLVCALNFALAEPVACRNRLNPDRAMINELRNTFRIFEKTFTENSEFDQNKNLLLLFGENDRTLYLVDVHSKQILFQTPNDLIHYRYEARFVNYDGKTYFLLSEHNLRTHDLTGTLTLRSIPDGKVVWQADHYIADLNTLGQDSSDPNSVLTIDGNWVNPASAGHFPGTPYHMPHQSVKTSFTLTHKDI